MPQAIDLTIKNAADADTTLTLMNPAAGDGGMASWVIKSGVSPSVYPELTLVARKTDNAARRADLKLVFPVASATEDAVPVILTRAEFKATVIMPKAFPEAKRDDFIALATNAFRTSLIQACMRDGIGAF